MVGRVGNALGDGGIVARAPGVEHANGQDRGGPRHARNADAVIGVRGDRSCNRSSVAVLIDGDGVVGDEVPAGGEDFARQIGMSRVHTGIHHRNDHTGGSRGDVPRGGRLDFCQVPFLALGKERVVHRGVDGGHAINLHILRIALGLQPRDQLAGLGGGHRDDPGVDLAHRAVLPSAMRCEQCMIRHVRHGRFAFDDDLNLRRIRRGKGVWAEAKSQEGEEHWHRGTRSAIEKPEGNFHGTIMGSYACASTHLAAANVMGSSIADASLARLAPFPKRLAKPLFGLLEEALVQGRVFVAAEVGKFFELLALLAAEFAGDFHQHPHHQVAPLAGVEGGNAFAA